VTQKRGRVPKNRVQTKGEENKETGFKRREERFQPDLRKWENSRLSQSGWESVDEAGESGWQGEELSGWVKKSDPPIVYLKRRQPFEDQNDTGKNRKRGTNTKEPGALATGASTAMENRLCPSTLWARCRREEALVQTVKTQKGPQMMGRRDQKEKKKKNKKKKKKIYMSNWGGGGGGGGGGGEGAARGERLGA